VESLVGLFYLYILEYPHGFLLELLDILFNKQNKEMIKMGKLWLRNWMVKLIKIMYGIFWLLVFVLG
jgi:hypothetical protein